jgi:hypothetical protein
VSRRALTLLLTGVCLVALAGPLAGGASATTIEVTTEAESGPGSLGQAILDSDPGDTISIPEGTYVLINGEVLEANDLRLVGAGEDLTTIIPGGGGGALDDPGVSTEGLTVGPPRNPDSGDDSEIETKVQIVALIATLALLILVLELVRRRRLAERYALLWMSAAVALLVLAIWRDGLDVLADLMGIADPANAIFILALGVTFVLLLHFSVATSRLAEETKILAQEVARLDQELRARGSNGVPEDLSSGRGSSGRGEPSKATTADQ